MNNNGIILTQGYKYLISILIISLIFKLLISDILANLGFIIFLFVAFIYRNPHRQIFANKNSLLSPIDGTVTAIDFKDGKQIIYCKVTPCNIAVVRSPENSSLKIKNYQNGLNLNPNSYKASILNEQVSFKFDTMKLKLISGICNPKIEFTQSKELLQGDALAIFVDGLAIITIKEDKKLLVNIGDKLKSAQTIICTK